MRVRLCRLWMLGEQLINQSINHMFGETLTWQKLNLKVEISFKKK